LLPHFHRNFLFAFVMKAFVAYAACAGGYAQCLDHDAGVLLQMEMHGRAAHKRSEKGVKLLQTVHQLVKTVNERQDPDSCQFTSDATRAAVDEELPAIVDQHTHFVNEVNDAADAVENCGKAESHGLGVLKAQKTKLEEFRDAHQECRMTEIVLQAGLNPCQQYEDLRLSHGSSKCVQLPNDEDGWIVAMQNHQFEMNTALDQAKPLEEACHKSRGNLAAQQPKCALAQARFESGYCEYRASCTSLQLCRSETEELYGKLAKEIREALETLHSEYQVLKHVECLLDKADEALNQGTIINADSVTVCSKLASIDHLMIDFPEFGELETCASTIISQPPCEGAFFDAEYKHLPEHEAIEAACVECTVDTFIFKAKLTNRAVGERALGERAVGERAVVELLNPDFEENPGGKAPFKYVNRFPSRWSDVQNARAKKGFDGWDTTGDVVVVQTDKAPWGWITASKGTWLLGLQRNGSSVTQSVQFEKGSCYALTVSVAQRQNSPRKEDNNGDKVSPKNANLTVSVGGDTLLNFKPQNNLMLPHTKVFMAAAAIMNITFENIMFETNTFKLGEPEDQTVLIDNIDVIETESTVCGEEN